MFASARQRHVGETSLFFELFLFSRRKPLVREELVLHSGQKDGAKLEALCAVHRHQHEARNVLHLIDVGHQCHPFEVAGEGWLFSRGLHLGFVFDDRTDELGEVLEARIGLGVVLVLEAFAIAGFVEHRGGSVARALRDHLLHQRRHERPERRDLLFGRTPDVG